MTNDRPTWADGIDAANEQMSRKVREQQMRRLETFARMKTAVEKASARYRTSDLTDGQFAAQIFLAILDSNVAFYLDD